MHLKQLLFLFCVIPNILTGFTLLIEPSGDARHPGRSIHGSYERGLSIQLTELLKAALERKDPTLTILIPRLNSQTVEPFEQASIANRLHVDAYIALMLYEQQESNPQLALYTYANDPSDTQKKYNPNNLQFVPFDQAHIKEQKTSLGMAEELLSSFKKKPVFTIMGNRVHTIPLKNLAGISAPHIALELSVQNLKQLHSYTQSLADALFSMITSLKEWNTRS